MIYCSQTIQIAKDASGRRTSSHCAKLWKTPTSRSAVTEQNIPARRRQTLYSTASEFVAMELLFFKVQKMVYSGMFPLI